MFLCFGNLSVIGFALRLTRICADHYREAMRSSATGRHFHHTIVPAPAKPSLAKRRRFEISR